MTANELGVMSSGVDLCFALRSNVNAFTCGERDVKVRIYLKDPSVEEEVAGHCQNCVQHSM